MIPYRFPSTEMFFGYCIGAADEILSPVDPDDDGGKDNNAQAVQALAIGAMSSFWLQEDFGVDGAVAYGSAIAGRVVEEDDEG